MAVPGRAATVPTAAKRPLSRQEGNVARARLAEPFHTMCEPPILPVRFLGQQEGKTA